MEVPQGLQIEAPGLVCKLNKSLYGLKQASRQWYDKLTEALCTRDFRHSENDYSLFCKKDGTSIVFVAVYVDDFTADLLKEYDHQYTTVSSPLDCTLKLKAEEGTLLADPTYYRKLVGKLNFLANTRLDIAYSVQHLSQFMKTPREPHLKAAFHVLRYLTNVPTLGIFFSNNPDCTVRAFCDSDWAACPDSRRSVSGYIVLLGDSPISWKSKKQEIVSLSSTEAEYRSVRKVVGELVWVKRLLEELTVPCLHPISVFCDSQAAVHMAINSVFHERTKNIEVDCHFVRDKLHEGLITLHHIPTYAQLEDVFTKALSGIKHASILGNLAVSSSPPT
ncbi:PREDICTED: uncharacterized protein LOC109211196 [Nicotiana attenuata]|uniref:uncharacterized protein LOC109211196 n=1 Tax=Nicotiana attenuata TaxID=49451 RepID=UPI000905844E|nr:PREDICTED: uncharacterized protein LOC109211196 [Nicotiana attenuata]